MTIRKCHLSNRINSQMAGKPGVSLGGAWVVWYSVSTISYSSWGRRNSSKYYHKAVEAVWGQYVINSCMHSVPSTEPQFPSLWIQLHYLWSKACLAGCSANHFFDQRMAVATLLLPSQLYQWLSNLTPMLPPFFATALFLCHSTHSLPNHHRFSAGDSIVVPIIVDIAMLYSQYCGVIG